MNKNLEKAVQIVKKGGIIIFPTDTVYDISCSADDENAVRKLFRIRRRQATKAVPVLFSDLNMVSAYVSKIPYARLPVLYKQLIRLGAGQEDINKLRNNLNTTIEGWGDIFEDLGLLSTPLHN